MNFTILGGGGFIGRHLQNFLSARGHVCQEPPPRGSVPPGMNLGHIVYCCGVRPGGTTGGSEQVEAHCGWLARILDHNAFDSLLYLSSVRVYGARTEGREVDTPSFDAAGAGAVYAATKAAGEYLCLAHPNCKVRVGRLASVYGPDFRSSGFLPSVLRSALAGHITFESAPTSAKDYVALPDVLELIENIVLNGHQRLYNVASGEKTSHLQLAEALAGLTKCTYAFRPGAPEIFESTPSISLICSEFSYRPSNLLHDLGALLDSYRSAARFP